APTTTSPSPSPPWPCSTWSSGSATTSPGPAEAHGSADVPECRFAALSLIKTRLACQAAQAAAGDVGSGRVEDLVGGQAAGQPGVQLLGGDLGPLGEHLVHLPADVGGEDDVGGAA